ncbi:hypothetical protein H6S82_09935 [Planktothrix sp. FACHB-1355]|uniref:hypothetical protein n=1 Tax=Oscillatoriophycideae TaxID=1301283 RepID=UPI0019AD92D6|nr:MULTISPECIES: hypothetical protein [Oscillatoriales]MBD3559179.1 hypothetical protein [Planktothrix sp. FACHB-1355]
MDYSQRKKIISPSQKRRPYYLKAAGFRFNLQAYQVSLTISKWLYFSPSRSFIGSPVHSAIGKTYDLNTELTM